MLSSQRLWPSSWSLCVAFMTVSLQQKSSVEAVVPPAWPAATSAGRSKRSRSPMRVDRDVRGRVSGQRLGVVRVVSLAREDGGHAGAPDLLDRGQDAQLVVDQHVVTGRVALLDVVQLLLLVDVDEHAAFDRLEEPGALDLARLEDHVAVGQDDRRSPGAEVLDHRQARRGTGGRRTGSPAGRTRSAGSSGRAGSRPGNAAGRRGSPRSRTPRAASRRSPSSGPRARSRSRVSPRGSARCRFRSAMIRSLSSRVLSTSSRNTTGAGGVIRPSPWAGGCASRRLPR